MFPQVSELTVYSHAKCFCQLDAPEQQGEGNFCVAIFMVLVRIDPSGSVAVVLQQVLQRG